MARKKKQTTVGQDASQLPVVQAKAVSVAPVALLIDGENVAIPDLLAHVLVEAGRMGGVTIRHVYGNWSAPVMQGWKKYLDHYGLEAKGNRAGPNATDIALVIGAMDLLYRGIKHFCLVAGDRDYVPLVERLRKDGCTVLVIGFANASQALQETSSRFLSTEQLLPGAAPAVVPVLASSASMDALRAVLLTAYQAVVEQTGGTEWLPLSQLGIYVRQCDATFEVWWYHSSRQKWTNFQSELSNMRKETCTDQIDRQKTAFCNLTTDDNAHNCKTGNSPIGHFSHLKPFDNL